MDAIFESGTPCVGRSIDRGAINRTDFNSHTRIIDDCIYKIDVERRIRIDTSTVHRAFERMYRVVHMPPKTRVDSHSETF